MLKSYSGAFIAWVRELPGQLGKMVCYRRDGKFYPELWICILFALLVIPAGKYCPDDPVDNVAASFNVEVQPWADGTAVNETI